MPTCPIRIDLLPREWPVGGNRKGVCGALEKIEKIDKRMGIMVREAG
jgi:hypothetical protein